MGRCPHPNSSWENKLLSPSSSLVKRVGRRTGQHHPSKKTLMMMTTMMKMMKMTVKMNLHLGESNK
ncbi:unnamed protein product [Timema podura]|uniref:Uncharacterized protein n=1 Tax=Timema podura TaxID=61482 RepID=A0ABN7PDH5_TIMPD|nr:unnamed protein product [Timema podura]